MRVLLIFALLVVSSLAGPEGLKGGDGGKAKTPKQEAPKHGPAFTTFFVRYTNVQFNGGTFNTITVANEFDCREACQDDNTCVAYTFDGANDCELKGRESTTGNSFATANDANGFTSAFKLLGSP
mmetsp:Transcript_27149/g.67689  ORF Transcript_27149/g.67689 Transcript_27149/m.67689 type:complete len:125 (-) Transcript_27149:114-488(-)